MIANWQEVFQKLPTSLQTNLSIYNNLESMKTIKFLGLGSLSFVIGIARFVIIIQTRSLSAHS